MQHIVDSGMIGQAIYALNTWPSAGEPMCDYFHNMRAKDLDGVSYLT